MNNLSAISGYRMITEKGGNIFPCLAGITLNMAGDFRIRKTAKENPEEEVKLNNILARRLVGESHYCKLIAEQGIRVIDAEKAGNWNYGDGLISYDQSFGKHHKRGSALISLTADCPTVVFSSPGQELIGILHCGWRGIYQGIIPAAMSKIREREIRIKKVFFGIFPGICSDCYEVGEEFKQFFPAAYKSGHLDMRAAIEENLLSLGAEKNNIFLEEYCSRHSREEGEFIFHSLRRDKTEKRNAVFIARKP
jgi:copper oxidase (laccase) domain-containing protein